MVTTADYAVKITVSAVGSISKVFRSYLNSLAVVSNRIVFKIYLVFISQYIEVSEPKWINSNYFQYGVNSFALGGLLNQSSFDKFV